MMTPMDDIYEAYLQYRIRHNQYPWSFLVHPATYDHIRNHEGCRDHVYIDRLGKTRTLGCILVPDTNVEEDSIIAWHPDNGRIRYRRKVL